MQTEPPQAGPMWRTPTYETGLQGEPARESSGSVTGQGRVRVCLPPAPSLPTSPPQVWGRPSVLGGPGLGRAPLVLPPALPEPPAAPHVSHAGQEPSLPLTLQGPLSDPGGTRGAAAGSTPKPGRQPPLATPRAPVCPPRLKEGPWIGRRAGRTLTKVGRAHGAGRRPVRSPCSQPAHKGAPTQRAGCPFPHPAPTGAHPKPFSPNCSVRNTGGVDVQGPLWWRPWAVGSSVLRLLLPQRPGGTGQQVGSTRCRVEGCSAQNWRIPSAEGPRGQRGWRGAPLAGAPVHALVPLPRSPA